MNTVVCGKLNVMQVNIIGLSVCVCDCFFHVMGDI